MSKLVRVSRDNTRAIVRVDETYVRVDLESLDVQTSADLQTLTAGGKWRTATKFDPVQADRAVELANAATTTLNVNERGLSERRRVYRVPNIVRDEALKALNWARASDSHFFDENQVQLAARISTSVSVDIDTIRAVSQALAGGRPDTETEFSSDGLPSPERVIYGLAGGEAAERWTSRVLGKHKTITASAFDFDATCVYLAGGPDPESTRVSQLYMVTPDNEYSVREANEWLPTETPDDALLIELDKESAYAVADLVDDVQPEKPDAFLELRNILPLEYNLWDVAKDSVDFEMLDRVALAAAGVWDDGRSPQERSETASRQQRAAGGQFSPGGVAEKGDKLKVFAKGRLPAAMPLIADAVQRINEYIVASEDAPAEEAAEELTEPVVAAPAPETATVEEATPETVSSSPLYVAVVDEADASAVLELVAIIPAAAGTNQGPTAWRRSGGAWESAPDLMADLQGLTPPPVVELNDPETAKAVISQIDEHDAANPSESDGGTTMAASGMWGPHGELLPIMAAGVPGVADTPGEVGNAERLRQYWTHGEGAAKIGWGTPGDWYRCVSHLGKYMGSRAKGYCTLRHHDATGFWPGQEGNRGDGLAASAAERLAPIKFEQAVYTMGLLAAASIADPEIDFVPFTYTPDTLPVELEEEMRRRGDKLSTFDVGGAFVIPLLLPEEVESGDGRSFDRQSLTTRDLPLPLLWQMKTGSGHDGAVIVGRLDSIERIENGLGRAVGVFDTGPYGREAERLCRAGMLTGVSPDLDKFEANTYEPDAEMSDDSEEDEKPDNEIKNDKIRATQARVMAATLVPKPAFQEVKILMVDNGGLGVDDVMEPLADGIYEEELEGIEAADVVLAALAASAAPVKPPKSWFNKPDLTGPTPLTIDDDGKVYGHIAAWKTDHIGLPRATKPPRSASNYAYFQTGRLRTEEGDDVNVGQLTLAGGHAPLNAGAELAVKHYDDTASAVADVSAGEDEHGIWVAGALRPGVTPEQVRVLRASAPSGDWRPINGRLELVAVCQVNVPGFPVARTMVAGGAVQALVAAGANYMAHLRDLPMQTLEQRVDAMEADALNAKRAAALSRLEPQRRARQEALTAAAEAARARMAPSKEKIETDRAALLASAAEARKRMGLPPREETAAVSLDAESVGEGQDF